MDSQISPSDKKTTLSIQHILRLHDSRAMTLKALYLLLVSGALYILFSRWAYDDPFITFRYAQNLRQGLGFVYNPGEQVQSTTTPLFAILLAVLSYLWDDLPQLAVFIGCVSLAFSGLVLWQLAKLWKTPRAGWAGLVLYPTFSMVLATLGSETPLYLALCLGAWVGYESKKYLLTSVCLALAVLTRSDALVVVGILAIDYLVNVRSAIPWSALLLFFALTAPWLIFSSTYFGSWVPATLFAKQQQAIMSGENYSFVSGFILQLQNFSALYQYWLEGLLGLGGVLFVAIHFRRALVFLLWAPLYFLAYANLGVTRYFWYYAPLAPAFIAAVGLGLTALGSKFFAKVALGFTVGLMFLLSFAQLNDLVKLSQNPDTRIAIYHDIGQWLQSNTLSDASVGALEVGMIGYYAQRRMIDFAGLLQPDIAMQLKPNATYEDAALWAVDHYHPDYLVLYDKTMPRLEQDYVTQHCVPVQHYSKEDYQFWASLSIYACSPTSRNTN